MKVILVSPYSEKQVGGIINWTRYILNYHKCHSGNVDLCLLNNESAVQVLASANPVKRVLTGFKNYIPLCRRFKEKIAIEHFDLVHICTSASFGLIRDLIIVQAARKRGIRTAVHMHFGLIPQILQTKGWERFLFLRLMRRVDCAIVMDRASLNALNSIGFENVCFLPNPLSSEVINMIEKQGVQQRDPRKILYAGHVVETKGIFELVEACHNIKGIKLEILGKVNSESMIQKLRLAGGEGCDEWMNIAGNKPFEVVIKEMLTCSMFVLPSYTEGFPNVILEGMACGCPIVATPVGAIAEMLEVDGDNPCGICVPIKNVNSLRKAIIYMLDNRDMATKMGENARKRVNELYVMPRVWEQLTLIWERLC